MSTDFTLPELGENITAGDVLRVLVKPGDRVERDQPVVELETDKATIEVPSNVAGIVKDVAVKVGDKVQVGARVLTVDADGAGSLKKTEPPAGGTPPPEAPPTAAPAEAPAAAQAPASTKQAAAVPEARPTVSGTAEFRIPELGENITAGDVLRVLVKVGDEVARDQPVVELETDKATIEVPSSVAGRVKELRVKAGDRVEVGQVVLTVEAGAGSGDQAAPASAPAASPASTAQASPAAPAAAPAAADAPSRPRGEVVDISRAPRRAPAAAASTEPRANEALPPRPNVPAAPSVRRLARELGLDIQDVPGTGQAGRISQDDVIAHAKRVITSRPGGGAVPAGGAASAPPLPDFTKWGEVERQPLRGARRKTAEHLSRAWATIPHVTQGEKADITELEALRQKYSAEVERSGGKLTMTAIVVKVVTAALKKYPQFNASIDVASEEIVLKRYTNIGIAVDTDHGLIVPVIRDADKKNLTVLSAEIAQAAVRARERKTSLEEMEGGTFTITNLGGIGGTYFTPIVNLPEAAILGMSRSRMEPVWKDDAFEPRLMLPLSLSYDHRIIDGADAMRFLRFVVEALEQPFMLSLHG
jgi:pyruvate dehydrogenase E2 component (dihydrolipoyllysine-residue acetyltransferase)